MISAKSSFHGYRRAAGRAGTRNFLLVLSTSGLTAPAARRVAAALPGSKLVSSPFGGGLVGRDKDAQVNGLCGAACNPNVGAVVLLGSDAPRMARMAAAIRSCGKPVAAFCLDDVDHDALKLSDRAIREGARLHREASRARRELRPVAELFLGIECGRSDPSSGLGSNPVIGRVSDDLLAAGGSVVFGETMEWLGAEHLLARRAADGRVADGLLQAVRRREQMAIDNHIDLTGNNPNPTNVAAGISTIEEKSLGSIAKTGSSRIAGVLQPSERPPAPGLYAMDAASFTPESLTGFVSSGAQILAFSTGAGNSYGSALAPTIKISSNPHAAKFLQEQLDYDVSGVMTGTKDFRTAASELGEILLDVASGMLTWCEVLGEEDEVIGRLGEAL